MDIETSANPEPIFHWKFEPYKEHLTRDSIQNQEAVCSEIIEVFPKLKNCDWGIYLNGKNSSYINLGHAIGQFGKQDFTLSFCIFTEEQDLEIFDLIGNRSAINHGNYFSIRMQKNGAIIVEINEDANGKNYIELVTKTEGFNNGQWHHIIVTRQANTLSIYVNNQLEGRSISFTGIANVQNDNDFIIGRSLVSEKINRFAAKATFKDLKIYNKALHPDNHYKLDLVKLVENFTPQLYNCRYR